MTMGFVETLSSPGTVRLDDIEGIDDAKPNQHGVDIYKVRLRGGKSFETFSSDRGGLLRRPVQLIPALPGTHIIRVDQYKGEVCTWRTPVAAWALCLDGEMRPVTPNGVNDGTDGRDVYVEMPCDRIEAVGMWSEPCGFEDAAAMQAHFYPGEASTPPERDRSFDDGLAQAAAVADEVLAQLRARPDVLLGWTVTQAQIRQAERIRDMILALAPKEGSDAAG